MCLFLSFSAMICTRDNSNFLKSLAVDSSLLLVLNHLTWANLTEGKQASEAAGDLFSLGSLRLIFLLSDEGLKVDATLVLESLIKYSHLLPFLIVDCLECESGGFLSHEPVCKEVGCLEISKRWEILQYNGIWLLWCQEVVILFEHPTFAQLLIWKVELHRNDLVKMIRVVLVQAVNELLCREAIPDWTTLKRAPHLRSCPSRIATWLHNTFQQILFLEAAFVRDIPRLLDSESKHN
jgi:hypothetical protein